MFSFNVFVSVFEPGGVQTPIRISLQNSVFVP